MSSEANAAKAARRQRLEGEVAAAYEAMKTVYMGMLHDGTDVDEASAVMHIALRQVQQDMSAE